MPGPPPGEQPEVGGLVVCLKTKKGDFSFLRGTRISPKGFKFRFSAYGDSKQHGCEWAAAQLEESGDRRDVYEGCAPAQPGMAQERPAGLLRCPGLLLPRVQVLVLSGFSSKAKFVTWNPCSLCHTGDGGAHPVTGGPTRPGAHPPPGCQAHLPMSRLLHEVCLRPGLGAQAGLLVRGQQPLLTFKKGGLGRKGVLTTWLSSSIRDPGRRPSAH